MNDDSKPTKPEGMPEGMWTLARVIRALNTYVWRIAVLIVLGLLGWLAWRKVVWMIVLAGVLLTILAGGFGVLVALQSRRRHVEDPGSDEGA
jgi:hypothetical protein